RLGGRDFRDLVLRVHFGQPQGTPPRAPAPAVVILSPGPGLVTRRNVTVVGQVTGNLAGVAALRARVDSGPAFDVPFDAAGGFQPTTALPPDGSADGPHTVTLQATDRAGNVAAAAAVSFTLVAQPGPAPPRFDLSAASRSGPAGDHSTAFGRVTLVGRTNPNTDVALLGTDLKTVSGSTGLFQLPGVTLAPG